MDFRYNMVRFTEVKENTSERRYFYPWVFKSHDVLLYKPHTRIKGTDSLDVNLNQRTFKNHEDFVCNVPVGHMPPLIWTSFTLRDTKKHTQSLFLNKSS